MGRGSEGLGTRLARPYTLLSLVPRLLFTEWENSLVNSLYRFGFEITVTSHQLDREFKTLLVNSKL